MSDYIKIGNVQKTHGIKGELTCHIQIAPDDFDDLNSIFIKQGGTLVPYFITSYQFNQDRLTLSLEDVNTLEKAKQLLNAELWVPAKYVSDDQYVWVDQIIGYDIIDLKKGYIGKVDNYYKIPNNELLSTEIEGKEILIPANTHIVKSINNDTKSITVELPEGLIELYLNDTKEDPDDDAY